ncbi:MAG: DNA topoisomerase [Lachnospiraceae bacterium]|nr:DNA topoisomerase [Lachnospiraceae bacterium]
MSKTIFIAEKPSVARQFAQALKLKTQNHNGYMESENTIITWCVGHLVTMSYPDAYDENLKKWSFSTLPFLPETYLYQVIDSAKEQFSIVSKLLNREDVDTIYVCTDSGREGEYIYRLVEMQANVTGKNRKRVWIDSQTDEEIIRGIKEAKDLSQYDALSDAAYLRAIEDYLMGINFSRALSLKYSQSIKDFLGVDKAVVAVGRVMTCVLGMVVQREREIRNFVKTPFYKILTNVSLDNTDDAVSFPAEFKAVKGSDYFESPLLYSEKGFKNKEDAEKMISVLPSEVILKSKDKKKESKNAPFLYNLTDLQDECSRLFKISPDQTLSVIQTLYERKLVTYPRTDARVLSSAVAKEIHKNIGGLKRYSICSELADEVLNSGTYKDIAKTKYVNDKAITDHYAVIPTGQGIEALSSLPEVTQKVYEIIVRRFLSIFYPAAEFDKVSVCVKANNESFFANFKVMTLEGYLKVTNYSFSKKKDISGKVQDSSDENTDTNSDKSKDEEEIKVDAEFLKVFDTLNKGDKLYSKGFEIKEGETSPPKRYNSGSLMKAMENAGQQIVDNEDLRALLKGSGIGTPATRSGILEKLCKNGYLKNNAKTQVITPELMGEMIYDVVDNSIKPLLDPRLTASWEKGLNQVAEGETSYDEYKEKLYDYVKRRTDYVRTLNNQSFLRSRYLEAAKYYKQTKKTKKTEKK